MTLPRSDSDRTTDSIPHIHVAATGGTIASTDADGGARPTLDGATLLEAAGLEDIKAELTVDTVADRPGFDMDLATLATALETGIDRQADATVVTHGTDTMAESAAAAALAAQRPVVCTGAQRRPDEPGADGGVNLRDAVRAALAGLPTGGYLAFGSEVYAGLTVDKVHSQSPAAFAAPGHGPVATLPRTGVRVRGSFTPASGPELGPSPLRAAAERDVPIVVSGTGVPGAHFERAATDADGVVIAATGLGNVTAGLGEAVAAISEDRPVVIASRCDAGPTDQVYGTAGGAVTLAGHDHVRFSDRRPAVARVLLKIALGADEPLSVLDPEGTHE